MSEREICGVCRGPWPCVCTPHAAPVVIMESVDDDYAAGLARRMRVGNAPLDVSAYVPEPPLKVDLGYAADEYCGHYRHLYGLNVDQRIAWCRQCGTVLDPYVVLEKLGDYERRLSERLKAAQELERRESQRERERLARAAVRRHRYAPVSTNRNGVWIEHCATCGTAADVGMHATAPSEGARFDVR